MSQLPSALAPSLADSVDADMLLSLDPLERARQHALRELAMSEEAYGAALAEVLQAYSYANCSAWLAKDMHDAVVGDLAPLLDLSRHLGQRLALRRSSDGTYDRIADIMIVHFPSIELVYARYCEKSAAAKHKIEALAASNANFAAFLAQGKQACGNMDIHSYRLRPLQRLTKCV